MRYLSLWEGFAELTTPDGIPLGKSDGRFGKVLREKLLASGSPPASSYPNILVDEIGVQDKAATIKGSYAALAEAMQQIKMGTLITQVPTFIPNWCARRDSNS